jgi:hypothetical protein
MTDRELLEAAARAAGMRYKVTGIETIMRGDGMDPEAWCAWSPLTDDGDALRLAVKMSILCTPEFAHFRSLERFGRQDADDYTATRYAIVQTAAAVADRR